MHNKHYLYASLTKRLKIKIILKNFRQETSIDNSF
jgi:hypothetical protein